MKHCPAHVCEAAVLAIEEANRPLCAQENEELMGEHLPETYREAATTCNDYCRVILSLQLSIVKYRASLPKGPGGPPVFCGLPDVGYDTGNLSLFGRRHKPEEEGGKARKRESAPTPITEHSDQYTLSSLISGMSCDQARHVVVK
jgi:hypothetical protein